MELHGEIWPFFGPFFFPNKIIQFVTNFQFVFAKSEKKIAPKKKRAGSTFINLNGIDHKVPCVVGLSVN